MTSENDDTKSAQKLFNEIINNDFMATQQQQRTSGEKMEAFVQAVAKERKDERVDVVTAARDCRERRESTILIDARSPGEYERGCIPNAVNCALFSDVERADVGRTFAKKGRADAMVLGMAFVRKKVDLLCSEAQELVDEKMKKLEDNDDGSKNKTLIRVYIHCWRGGMRSLSLGWLFAERLKNVESVKVVNGGYKSFRTWILSRCGEPIDLKKMLSLNENGNNSSNLDLDQEEEEEEKGEDSENENDDDDDVLAFGNSIIEHNINHPKNKSSSKKNKPMKTHPNDDPFARQVLTNVPAPPVCIIGGRTGTGKTRCLLALEKLRKEQIIDLEGLANHSGSAFGWVGKKAQPTSEQYGNKVAFAWDALDPKRWVFIEDEGPHVGRCSVDPKLFQRMREAPLILRLICPLQLRIQTLVSDYATDELRAEEGWMEGMRDACEKMTKRIGGDKQKKLKISLESGNWAAVAEQLLEYYDGLYDKHIAMKRDDSKKHRQKLNKLAKKKMAKNEREPSTSHQSSKDVNDSGSTLSKSDMSELSSAELSNGSPDGGGAGEKERQGTVVDIEVFANDKNEIDEERLTKDVLMAVALFELTSVKIDEEVEDLQSAISGSSNDY
jgi:tRNA 2-selenouridine synthase SelU